MPEGITWADHNAAALGPLSCLATITSRVSSLSSSNCLVGFQSLLSVISLRFGSVVVTLLRKEYGTG